MKKAKVKRSINYRQKAELVITDSPVANEILPKLGESKNKTKVKNTHNSNSKSSEYLKSLNYIQQKAEYDIFTDDCSCGHHKYDHGPACDHCECRRFIA